MLNDIERANVEEGRKKNLMYYVPSDSIALLLTGEKPSEDSYAVGYEIVQTMNKIKTEKIYTSIWGGNIEDINGKTIEIPANTNYKILSYHNLSFNDTVTIQDPATKKTYTLWC